MSLFPLRLDVAIADPVAQAAQIAVAQEVAARLIREQSDDPVLCQALRVWLLENYCSFCLHSRQPGSQFEKEGFSFLIRNYTREAFAVRGKFQVGQQ